MPKAESLDISTYARRQIAARLDDVAGHLRATLTRREKETVHDLRVAIRRFSEALKVFRSLLPEREAKKVRKTLRKVMDAAAEVRDRDIALQFCKKAGLTDEDELCRRILRDRARAEGRLEKRVRRLHEADLIEEWRGRLGLSGEAS